MLEPKNPWLDPKNPWLEPKNPWLDPKNPWLDPKNPWLEPKNPWIFFKWSHKFMPNVAKYAIHGSYGLYWLVNRDPYVMVYYNWAVFHPLYNL